MYPVMKQSQVANARNWCTVHIVSKSDWSVVSLTRRQLQALVYALPALHLLKRPLVIHLPEI